MFFTGHYQNGYVTHDLDRAMELVSRRFGLADYLRFDPTSSVVRTPEGTRPYDARVAMAWSGMLQIELIQPLGDSLDLYRDTLPEDPSDFAPRFHHVAVRRPNLAAMRREIDEVGAPVLLKGQVPGVAFAYLDLRRQLGHVVEVIWGSEDMWAYMGWPDGKPAG